MTTTRKCPQCGAEMTETTAGLCPACLMKQAMASKQMRSRYLDTLIAKLNI